MGIFDKIRDFFRKKPVEAESIERPAEAQEDVEKLPAMIEEELKIVGEKAADFKAGIKKDLEQFTIEVNSGIGALKQIDIEKRRETDRLKNMVREGLSLYMMLLEKLLEDIKKIESDDVERYMIELGLAFNRFAKNSKMAYEKATILIGKELEEARKTINDFAKAFNEKMTANRGIFERIKELNNLKASLGELEGTKKAQADVESSIKESQEKLAKLEQDKQAIEKEYEDYGKSEEYANFIAEQEKMEEDNKKLAEDISRLKQELDFKALARSFHDDEKKNQLIKTYSEDFIDALKADESLEIVGMVKAINPDFDESEFKNIRTKLAEQKMPEKDKRLTEFEDKLRASSQALVNEQDNLAYEQQKRQKFEAKRQELIAQINEKARKR